MRKSVRIGAVAAVAALTLAACGEKENGGSGTEGAEQIDFKACMVSDSGGFDDKSFNQTSLKGLNDAKEEIGVETATVESAGDAEYTDNISQLVEEGCNQITTVGFLLGDATLAAAEENADVDFAIVDYAYFDESGENIAPKNLKGLTFNTAEPSFLAGYVAAASSESGKVGTFGGLNIPTVTAFMTGFMQGVEKYNEDSGEAVELLGWDGTDGSFTEDFEDKGKGQQVAEQMIQQGADVIFPVAGPAGLGGLQAAKDAGAWGVWVDTDGCVSAAEYCDILLTSVLKGMDVAVQDAIQASVDEEFDNEPYTGTLENGGVGLADFNDVVDEELSSTIDDLKEQIINGDISVG